MKKQYSYINQKDPVNRILSFCLASLLTFVLLVAFVLASFRTSATGSTSVESDVSVTVPASCTMGGVGSNTHNATLNPGTWSGASGSDYENGIGKTTLTTFCNDFNGFSIYAIGYTGNTYGNTNLVGASTSANIVTGTSTSGATSNWSMKVTKETDSTKSYNPVNMTITNNFDNNNYHEVPSTYTKVAQYKSSTGGSITDRSLGAKIYTTYAAYISSTQVADTYEGQVKYTVVHPYNADVPGPTLYDSVALMSKGKQNVAGIQAEITIPTSANRNEDTSNSGVYEYDPTVFGTASDASNDYKIYYYRGVLENTPGTYGSDGSAVTYPNYVVLSSASNKNSLVNTDTCWRIVRTTGSGGVKMIYNGTWTGFTCANATTDAQLADVQAFGLKGNSTQLNWRYNINRVGYTFNNDISIQDITTETSVNIVFGSDANPSLNNARSNIKTYIEDTWYANNMTAYTSILESSAGYCNDRTAYSGTTAATALATIPPYRTSDSGQSMRFGAWTRNMYTNDKAPSLNCPRNTVDLYRYVENSPGVSNELKYPTALLTADEVSFAGSGRERASQGSSYDLNSYLRSGSYFWLFTPSSRYSDGGATESILHPKGYLSDRYIAPSNDTGVRPAVSLISGTTPISGTGIATDPWIVNPQ